MMAERIVDVLEIVEIDEQYCQLVLVAVCLRDGLLDTVLQQHAIGQVGQCVVMRHVTNLFFCLLALGILLLQFGIGFSQFSGAFH